MNWCILADWCFRLIAFHAAPILKRFLTVFIGLMNGIRIISHDLLIIAVKQIA